MSRLADARPPDAWSKVMAALDLGTNNCRLLIASPAPPETEGAAPYRVLDAFSRLVRLGEGLRRTGHLTETAMARTRDALAQCAEKMSRCEVTRLRAVATEACRAAANAKEFLAEIRRDLGLPFEIISGEEEARLAMLGCMPLISEEASEVLMFDIGGGSTEFVWLKGQGQNRQTIDHLSIPVGVMALTEDYGGTPVVPRANYEKMVETVMAAWLPFAERHGINDFFAAGTAQLLGCSGTVTTLAGLKLGLVRYRRERVDGIWLETKDALRLASELLRLDQAGRADLPCVGTERADLIIAGCAVLEGILRGVNAASRLRIGDRGVREGILYELMNPPPHVPPDPPAMAAPKVTA